MNAPDRPFLDAAQLEAVRELARAVRSALDFGPPGTAAAFTAAGGQVEVIDALVRHADPTDTRLAPAAAARLESIDTARLPHFLAVHLFLLHNVCKGRGSPYGRADLAVPPATPYKAPVPDHGGRD